MTIEEAIVIIEKEIEWVEKRRTILETDAKKSKTAQGALATCEAHKLAIEALSYFLDTAGVLLV